MLRIIGLRERERERGKIKKIIKKEYLNGVLKKKNRIFDESGIVK